MVMSQNFESSRFYCTKCGNETIPIVRMQGRYRELGHLKVLYCPYCRKGHNCVEVRPQNRHYTYENFMDEFNGFNFNEEGERIMPFKEFVKSKKQYEKTGGILIIMCGIPGSGKSTFLNLLDEDAVVVSRDKIRFSMIDNSEDYFKYEKRVFREFVRQINLGLAAGCTVYADATHINEASRAKLLNALNVVPEEVGAIYFNTPLGVCFKRNAARTGLAHVPDEVVIRMSRNFTIPSEEEGFDWVEEGISNNE